VVVSTNPFNSLLGSRPRKVGLLAAVLVIVLVVSSYAYMASLQTQEGPRVTITSPPVEFSIELDKTEYQFGENVTIIFCLKNISNQTIIVGKPYWWPIDPSYNILATDSCGANISGGAPVSHLLNNLFHFGLSIISQNGTEVFNESTGIFPTTYDIIIEPNGYVKQTLIWNNNWKLLPKDTYQIRGIQDCGILGLGSIILETPTITFTIR
jgi:hypothetical protein